MIKEGLRASINFTCLGSLPRLTETTYIIMSKLNVKVDLN